MVRLLLALLCGFVPVLPAVGGGTGPETGLPPLSFEPTFSFELGAVPSSELLPGWQKSVTAYPLRGDGNRTRTRTIYFQPRPGPAGAKTADCTARSTAAVCASFGIQLIVDAVSYPVRGGYTGTEWSLEFRNTGSNQSLPLCAVQTLNASIAMPPSANLTVSAVGGGPFAPPARLIGDPRALAPGPAIGDIRFGPSVAFFPVNATKALGSGSTGRSSEGGIPFWSAYTTTSSGYSGITASVGWSGFWAASLSRDAAGLTMTAGQGEYCAPILPGSAVVFPRVLVVEWEGDSPQIGPNAHRRIVVDHKLPRDPATGQPVGMTSESNGCSDRCGGADSWRVFNMTTQLWHLDALQETGVEGLWLDASWFKGDFGPNGNWALPISAMMSPAFPGGLGVLGRAAHNPPKGKPQTNFIVWIEPERVSPGAYLDLHFKEKLLAGTGGYLVNLGDEEMRNYIIEFISTAVEEFELDTFRTDFNIGPLSHWRANDLAMAAKLTPSPSPGPPMRICPKVQLTNNSDIPAGKFGPAGTYDICQYAEVALTAEACGAACCAMDGTNGTKKCTRFVWASATEPQPIIESACSGQKLCGGAVKGGACCYLKGGDGLKARTGTYTSGTVENTPTPPSVVGVSQGVTENKYTHGLYQYWDAVRHRQPHLAIDNCAGGGNRIDLESLSRTVFLWRNDADNNIMFAGRDPVDQQADTLALSMFAPVNNGNIHCKHYPDAPDVSNTALDPYIWRGASMTGGGIHSSEDFWHWVLAEPARVSALQAAVRERKDLRRLAISGDYWILSPTTGGAPSGLADPTRWAAWQLHDPDEGTGCVTLLRRPNATEASITLGLRGLSASATFNVSFASGFMIDRAEQMSGEKLAALSVQLEPSHSIVLRYTRI